MNQKQKDFLLNPIKKLGSNLMGGLIITMGVLICFLIAGFFGFWGTIITLVIIAIMFGGEILRELMLYDYVAAIGLWIMAIYFLFRYKIIPAYKEYKRLGKK